MYSIQSHSSMMHVRINVPSPPCDVASPWVPLLFHLDNLPSKQHYFQPKHLSYKLELQKKRENNLYHKLWHLYPIYIYKAQGLWSRTTTRYIEKEETAHTNTRLKNKFSGKVSSREILKQLSHVRESIRGF